MALPQFGIFSQGTHAHYFVEFDIWPDAAPESITTSFRRLRGPAGYLIGHVIGATPV